MISSLFFPSSLNMLFLITLTFILSTIFLLRRKQPKDDRKYAPGPTGLPFIGNLHMLGNLPHRTLAALSKKHGSIMSLRLGNIESIVVSSSSAAEQFGNKTNDIIFASRQGTQATHYLGYGTKGLVFAEYGAYWRNMRKVCTLQLLSVSKVDSFEPLRKREMEFALKSLKKSASLGEVVDVSEFIQNVTTEIVYKMMLGCSQCEEFDLKGLIQRRMNLVGTFNIADYIPFLGLFDLQGLKRNFKKTSKALDQVLESIIKELEQSSQVENGEKKNKNFMDILLSLVHQPIDPCDKQSQPIEKPNIKAVILDIIAGASETTASVLEWTVSELIRHPRVMKKLQQELDDVIGMNKLVEESDLAKLSYLDIVVKEILRLYPAGPLVPRESTEDVTIDGYFIKRKTRIIVNLWAIGRDTKVWSNNADEFYPERFIDKNFEYRGDFQYVPFGFGRRSCPGINLGLITVKLVLAQLIHCFSWELPSNMAVKDLDMDEKFGLSVPRAKHLSLVPTYRLSVEAT